MLQSMKNSKSRDIDDLQIQPVKFVCDIIAPVLEYIINLIFSSSIYPKKLQVSKVSVIFKGGDKSVFSNYRPISIIPIFSKCIEKLLGERITSFVQKHKILTDCQYGFVKGKSTETALLMQKELILESFENQSCTLGIYIDFSKAFDCLNHETLLLKLECYGFRGTFLELIRSYLTHRQQHVVVHGQLSYNRAIDCGVPQGSILGPLLFNLYVNDIVRTDHNAKFIIYADDASLFFSARTIAEMVKNANAALHNLLQWSTASSLIINPKKTKAILFRPKNKAVGNLPNIVLGSTYVEIVPSIKSIGVTLHENMLWDTHVTDVAKRLAKIVGVLTRVRSLLPQAVKHLIYNCLFHSCVSYCHLVWGVTTCSNILRLHRLQKKAVRMIANTSYYSHTQPLFSSLNIVPITTLYSTLLERRYKKDCINSNHFFDSTSQLTQRDKPYQTRNNDPWQVPCVRTNYGRQMLRFQILVLLNRLFHQVIT